MTRRTRIVAGPLALKMQRLRAAREGAIGLEIMTLPMVAARLAGGFCRPAMPEDLQPAIRAALSAADLQDLEGVRSLPGMVRAVQRTLSAAWRGDVALDPAAGPRLADLAELDRRVRDALPLGVMVPPDLRDAALGRVAYAAQLLGGVELSGLVDVDPVWRPLVVALAGQTPLAWTAPCEGERGWFPGELTGPPETPAVESQAVVCADPRAEVVEALRWARGLMASGVAAADIAIVAAACDPWDEAMLVLARGASLPVHFTHGTAALEEPAGQACAALADVLLRGLSQARVRRLLRRSARASAGLPTDWARGLRRSAGLFTTAQWRAALVGARAVRGDGAPVEETLLACVEALAQGLGQAAPLGEQFLDGPALALWRQALRAAPPEALELSLQALRVPDGVSPGAAIAWGPAEHLAAAPLPYVRLLGLTGRGWPRAATEDPLLPDHVLPRARLEPVPRPEQDLRLFAAIQAYATGGFVLSRSHRSAEGALLPPSRLFPSAGAQVLAKVRTPAHAFSEADRLFARPLEALARPSLALGRAGWRAWQSTGATAWDGQVPAADPVIQAALQREQSATSLRRLLRDPLGFVWRYALGWRPTEVHVDVLTLDPAGFGELVHEVIRLAVERLEPTPGLNRATREELEAALAAAGDGVVTRWPAERPVPPPLLWRRTVDEAVRLARDGLHFDQGLQPGTRSWSEASFGEGTALAPPWEADVEVRLAGLRIGGRIDRLDLRGDGGAARVTDYKTGAAPKNIAAVALGGGAELQRVTYAAAVRQRLPDVRQVVSRLTYLRGGPAAHALSGDALDAAIAEAERFIAAAVAVVSAGSAPPGPDAQERFNDLRLALPSELEAYSFRKARALSAAAGELPGFWRAP